MRLFYNLTALMLVLGYLSACSNNSDSQVLDGSISDAIDPIHSGYLEDLNAFCSGSTRLAIDGQDAVISATEKSSETPGIPMSSDKVPCQQNQVSIAFSRQGKQDSERFYFCLVANDKDGHMVNEKIEPPHVVLFGEYSIGSAWMWLGNSGSGTAYPADSNRGYIRGYASVSGTSSDRRLSVCMSTTMFESIEKVKLLRLFADQIPLDN